MTLYHLFLMFAMVAGAVIGFLCGIEGTIVGGHYEDGLSHNQLKYLNEHSKVYRITAKLLTVITLMGTPIGWLLLAAAGFVWFAFDPHSAVVFACTYKVQVLMFAMLYILAMLAFYFVGIWRGYRIQHRLGVQDVE